MTAHNNPQAPNKKSIFLFLINVIRSFLILILYLKIEYKVYIKSKAAETFNTPWVSLVNIPKVTKNNNKKGS